MNGQSALHQQNRALQRWQLVHHLRVFDANSGALMGHLVNISAEGIMLISDQVIPIEQNHQLQMELPGDSEEPEIVLINAYSIWFEADDKPLFYQTGFQLLELSDEALKQISSLIEQLDPNSLKLTVKKA